MGLVLSYSLHGLLDQWFLPLPFKGWGFREEPLCSVGLEALEYSTRFCTYNPFPSHADTIVLSSYLEQQASLPLPALSLQSNIDLPVLLQPYCLVTQCTLFMGKPVDCAPNVYKNQVESTLDDFQGA